MATTSHTSTSTLASTPTNGSSDGTDTIADLFTSGSSPPLIVTFLAIGVFVIAITGVFGWRRLSRSRVLDPQPVVGPNHGHKSVPLGQRPLLWDLQVREQAAGWANSTPMTAILTFLSPPRAAPFPSITSVDPGSRVLFRTLRCGASAVKRFFLPDPPPPPPPTERNKNASSTLDDEIEWGDASSLQVSVIIAMPTRRRSGSGISDSERMELGEFCIGTMDMAWSEGG